VVDIRLTRLGRALSVAAALVAGPAAADPPQARAAIGAREAIFRDWVLRCPAGGCAIRTAVRGTDGTEVLGLAVAAEGAALTLRTALPLHLPDGATLALGDDPLRIFPWRTCDPSGCVVDAPLAEDLGEALRRERSVEVTLTLVDGVRVRLSASLLGFSAALDALAPPPPAAPQAEVTP
jgi:invasion protein IalB